MRQTSGAILVREGRVLLGLRSPAKKTYANCWDVPGGHRKEDETALATLVRELREELGVTPIDANPLVDVIDGCIVQHLFLVTRWSGGEPRVLGEEHVRLTWFSYREAIALPNLALGIYRDIFAQLAAYCMEITPPAPAP